MCVCVCVSPPVKHVKSGEGRIVQPGQDLDVVEQFGSDREEISKERPERGSGRLARDPPHSHINTSLRIEQEQPSDKIF